MVLYSRTNMVAKIKNRCLTFHKTDFLENPFALILHSLVLKNTMFDMYIGLAGYFPGLAPHHNLHDLSYMHFL